MVYTVYALVDPRTMQEFYVGCTKDAKQRLKAHISGQSYGGAWERNRELRRLHLKPIMQTLAKFPDIKSAAKAERENIIRLGSKLLNRRADSTMKGTGKQYNL